MLSKIQNSITRLTLYGKDLPPKDFYQIWRPTNRKQKIKSLFFHELENNTSVFEFGCHNGFNLEWIQELHSNIEVYGIDLNKKSIQEGQKKNRDYISIGDEFTLKHLRNYDTVFTSSVLTHIEDIDFIISELKRIAVNEVIVIETNEFDDRKYYFHHDYERFGFRKIRSARMPLVNGNGLLYYQWVFEK